MEKVPTMQTLTQRTLVPASGQVDLEVKWKQVSEVRHEAGSTLLSKCRPSIYTKQNWTELKGELDGSILMESFKIPFSIIGGTNNILSTQLTNVPNFYVDINIIGGDHLIKRSVCYTPQTNVILYVNCN